MSTRRIAAALLAAVSVAGLSACGNKEDRVTEGKTEGAYIDVGPLKYQVQISRQLNPVSTEDRAYLKGVSAANLQLKPDETFFAVFVRVENESGHAAPTARDFTIEDTQHNVFRPLPVGGVNALAYQPQVLQNDHILPDPDSIAAFGPTQGALLLFKLPNASLDNRPLELIVQAPTAAERGTITLDV